MNYMRKIFYFVSVIILISATVSFLELDSLKEYTWIQKIIKHQGLVILIAIADLVLWAFLLISAKIDKLGNQFNSTTKALNKVGSGIFPNITSITRSGYFDDIPDKNEVVLIHGVNGLSFINAFRVNENLEIKMIKMIVPSQAAIQSFYATTNIVGNKDNAVDIILQNKAQSLGILEGLRQANRITSYKVKEIPSFPLECYFIESTDRALLGKYIVDPTRYNGSIGLASSVWITNNHRLVKCYSSGFNKLWEGISAE